jgi:hypothetical protein
MFKMGVICKELPRVMGYFVRKSKETQYIAGNIAVKVGLNGIMNLRLNAPVFEGNLAKIGIQGRLVLFKYMARYWIEFPLPYTRFANSGRREVYPKRKKFLKWYKTPHMGNPIYTKYSPPTGDYANMSVFRTGNPTHFIERGIVQTQNNVKSIAQLELERWLLN